MEIRWVPYSSIAENIQTDLEIIMLYSNPTEGVTLSDIHRYVADISLIYAKLCSCKNKMLTSEIVGEIYNKNDEFFEIALKNTFKDIQQISLLKAAELLQQFMVPDIG